ncbi:MAG TPA: cell division protein FtsZ [Opitutaceae bacterium]|nr:cell division protein FtsZ [Opitutaceae bacterium]
MSDQQPENILPLNQEMLTDRAIAIKVIGVGGAGSNAVDRLKMENLGRVQLAVLNTDSQALASSPVQEKLLLGAGVTRGLGAGGDPELGRLAAEGDREKIAALAEGADLVFILAGMGGGTGSGASPVVGEIFREAGALVIAFVTMPFTFEGGRRLKQAEDGLAELRRTCDAVIPLPNDILLQETPDRTSVLDAFSMADEWIGRGVRSIWAMLNRTGLINLDYATLRQAFSQKCGKTLFGLGAGEGENAVADALSSLKTCPLLHTPEFSRKADRILVNIIGGPDLGLAQVNEMMADVADQFGRDAHIYLGAVIDEGMSGRIELCVIGTSDIGRGPVRRTAAPAPSLAIQNTPVRASAAARKAADTPAPAARPTAATTAAAAAAARAAARQDEFSFTDGDARGRFDNTDRFLFEGQDLDTPTYLRKGIKVLL